MTFHVTWNITQTSHKIRTHTHTQTHAKTQYPYACEHKHNERKQTIIPGNSV